MREVFERRAADLQRHISGTSIDLLLVTDPVSIYFLAGYWGYVDIEFGRPTILCIPKTGEFTLITPKLESEMARAMTWIEDLRTYADGVGGEWRDPLAAVIGGANHVTCAVEVTHAPGMVTEYLRADLPSVNIVDGSEILGALHTVKTPDEIELMRKAGLVAVAMGEAARDAIAADVPEYEVALAILAGGTRKAAELMAGEDPNSFDSPMIYNLQPLQSGHYTSMPHRRATMRKIRMGEPVFICFCGIANFKHFKPGYDRQYFLGSVSDENARIYEIAVAGQQAAIAAMGPGVSAEDVHFAAEQPYLQAGINQPSHRTGRAIGYSVNELPQLKAGDKTILQPGMMFAVGGDVTLPGKCCGRVSDTILITETGAQCLTESPRELLIL
jgi:Xaa-Pro dipeptidase